MQGWVGLNLVLGPGDFNLGLPYLSLGIFPLGPTGHLDVPVTVPNLPALNGLTVWFQFGAGNDDFATWGPGPRISVPESITLGG